MYHQPQMYSWQWKSCNTTTDCTYYEQQKYEVNHIRDVYFVRHMAVVFRTRPNLNQIGWHLCAQDRHLSPLKHQW